MWHHDLFYQWARRESDSGAGNEGWDGKGRIGCFQDRRPQFELTNLDWQGTMALSIAHAPWMLKDAVYVMVVVGGLHQHDSFWMS